MPRLRSVVVDCSRSSAEIKAFLGQFWEDLKQRNEMDLRVEVASMGPLTFRLRGDALRGVDILFEYGASWGPISSDTYSRGILDDRASAQD